MPQPGTSAGRKPLFSGRRTVTVDTTLTAADIGRTIYVDDGGAVVITMPVIPGVPPTSLGANDGENSLGAGGSICIIQVGAGSVSIVLPVPALPGGAAADTFNTQAGPIALAVQNEWVLMVSDGGRTNPGNWDVIGGDI